MASSGPPVTLSILSGRVLGGKVMCIFELHSFRSSSVAASVLDCCSPRKDFPLHASKDAAKLNTRAENSSCFIKSDAVAVAFERAQPNSTIGGSCLSVGTRPRRRRWLKANWLRAAALTPAYCLSSASENPKSQAGLKASRICLADERPAQILCG